MAKKNTSFSTLWLYFVVPFVLLLLIKYAISAYNGKDGSSYQVMSGKENVSKVSNELPETIDYIFDVKPILSDRCYLCHGPDDGTREAGLRLDLKESAYAALGENLDRFAIVPGNIDSSQMVYRINHPDIQKRMPPQESNLTLSEYERNILVKWIEQGAVWKDHWAFVVPEKPDLPLLKNAEQPDSEIDIFILEKLGQKGMQPSERASKEKQLRRVYFDLTGLPPSLKDIDEFVNNSDPDAYEKVVDGLLSSDAYGERMASDWLDLARYADTHGYQDDLERIMWPWRDWVIDAFNRNVPYDQFVTWQLAGDLIPDASLEQILATGFNRNHKITQEGGVIDEEYRVEYVMDRTVTTSKALLGLTMECARCHNHKYDPISQKEFYEFYSFFNQVNEKGRIEYDELPEPNITITKELIDQGLPFVKMPDSIKEVKLMVMRDDPSLKRKTHILSRGTYNNPVEEVEMGTPVIIKPFDEEFQNNRLGLANWFFDKDNPLTARVAVNRLWQQMYGAGIVSSTGDFGNQGDLPSHPELLDWLAVTFQEENWDVKKMLKRMAMSNTYRQTSKSNAELQILDPENRWYARSSRDKLTAEMIRDNALFTSGLLINKIGGPSVKPYQPEGLWAETTSGQGLTKYIQDVGENSHRRSLYTFWKRTVPPPSMMTFDAASRDDCTVKRQKTSTPLQALALLNDPQMMEASEALAKRVLLDFDSSDEERVTSMFRMLTSRFPDKKELQDLLEYLRESEADFEANTSLREQDNSETNSKPDQLYAYAFLANLIFNLDEAIIKG
jgi:hypothetical protein